MDSTYIISPIAVDLGGKYTGVFLAHHAFDEDPANGTQQGHLLVIPEDQSKITWSQTSRRLARHQARNYKRRKLAKRLLSCVLSATLRRTLAAGERNALNGLLNRRGFNRMDVETDWELLEEASPDWHAEQFDQWFNAEKTLAEQLSGLLQRTDELDNIAGDLGSCSSKRDVKKAVKAFFGEERPEVVEAHSQILEAMAKARDSLSLGARHRREYLQNIKTELDRDSRLEALRKQLDSTELLNLVGNISNLQWKPLHWYFDDKKMAGGRDYFDDARLLRVLVRWLENWRPQNEVEKQNRKAHLEALKRMTALQWLKETDPATTIPPYEDQNNRRPPKDQTLWLNPDAMTRKYGTNPASGLPNWQLWTRNLRKAGRNRGWDDQVADIVGRCERKSRRGRMQENRTDYEDALFLMRLLDRSRAHDPYALRALAKGDVSTGLETCKEHLARDLGAQHLSGFLNLCRDYYAEIQRARSGLWSTDPDNLLEAADLNPPRKSRILHVLVGQILGEHFSERDLKTFVEQCWLAREGRSTVRSRAETVEKTRKKYGNSFDRLLKRAQYQASTGQKLNKKSDEAAILAAADAADAAEQACERIARYLDHDDDKKQRYNNCFSIAQLYTLLETDRKGYSRTTLAVHKENSWRMEMIPCADSSETAARCSRLSADSVRPFDGVLRRIIERQAMEIARLKVDQIKAAMKGRDEPLSIPVLIEDNRFEFTQGLHEVKKNRTKASELTKRIDEETGEWADKFTRIRQDSRGICAYTGDSLDERNGELDHILPQSFSRTRSGTVFNSEANLIWVSRRGNQLKKDKRYRLTDLSPRYLEAHFGTADTERISESIESTLKGLPENKPFDACSEAERKALRHALFLEDNSAAFSLATQRLATRMKSHVNGTQAWFARTLIRMLTARLEQERLTNIDFSVHRIPADQVGLYRQQLAMAAPELKKENIQSAYSHVVDAFSTCVTGLQNHEPAGTSGVLAEDTEWALRALPSSLQIHQLERLKPYSDKKDQSGIRIFKDGIYAEHFLPLWWNAEGVWAGFSVSRKDGGEPPASVKVEGRNPESLLRVLEPVLEAPLPDKAPEGMPRCFQVDKTKAISVLHSGELDGKSAPDDLLAALHILYYTTQQRKVKQRLLDSGETKLKKEADVLKEQPDFSVSVKGGWPGRARNKEWKVEGKLRHPVYRDWKRVLDYARSQVNATGELPDWQQLGEQLFRPGSNRAHRKSRREFSLPIVTGAFRRLSHSQKHPGWSGGTACGNR